MHILGHLQMQTGVSWMLYVWFIKPMVFLSSISICHRKLNTQGNPFCEAWIRHMGFHGDSSGTWGDFRDPMERGFTVHHEALFSTKSRLKIQPILSRES